MAVNCNVLLHYVLFVEANALRILGLIVLKKKKKTLAILPQLQHKFVYCSCVNSVKFGM